MHRIHERGCHHDPHVGVCSLAAADPNLYSWGENYAGSSGLMSVSPDLNPMQRARSGTVGRYGNATTGETMRAGCPAKR